VHYVARASEGSLLLLHRVRRNWCGLSLLWGLRRDAVDGVDHAHQRRCRESGLVLVVNGNHFRPDSTVNWNGATRTTTFVSAHQLTASIGTGDLATPSTVQVAVFSPPEPKHVTFGTNGSTTAATASFKADCVGGTSKALSFTVNP